MTFPRAFPRKAPWLCVRARNRSPSSESQGSNFIPADRLGRPLNLGATLNRRVMLPPLTAPKILWYPQWYPQLIESGAGDVRFLFRAGSADLHFADH